MIMVDTRYLPGFTVDASGTQIAIPPRTDMRTPFQRQNDADAYAYAARDAVAARREALEKGTDGGPSAGVVGRMFGYFADDPAVAGQRAARVAELNNTDWDAARATAMEQARKVMLGTPAVPSVLMSNPSNPRPVEEAVRRFIQPAATTDTAPAAKTDMGPPTRENAARLFGDAVPPRVGADKQQKPYTLTDFLRDSKNMSAAQLDAYSRTRPNAPTPLGYKDVAGFNLLNAINTQANAVLADPNATDQMKLDAYNKAQEDMWRFFNGGEKSLMETLAEMQAQQGG